ncbi:hypothetical protein H2203_001007 [Taxawa tesnikishii (nom. ined.)]|nr:hypothetical protein H2203_001007 [Dothideales sp. JES 119]
MDGRLNVYPPPKDLVFTKGESSLQAYRFGPKRFTHYFCPTCGATVKAVATDPTHPWYGATALNVRTFEDVSIDDLKIKKFNGKEFSTAGQ